MALEDILKPIKTIDKEILAQYTRLGEWMNLRKGKRAYWVGMGLWGGCAVSCSLATKQLSIGIIGGELLARILVSGHDFSYNLYGLLGRFPQEQTGMCLRMTSQIGSS